MTTTRTNQGLAWVVSMAFVAIAVFFTPPGMFIFSALTAAIQFALEQALRIDAILASMLLSVVILVTAVRIMIMLLTRR